MSIAERITQAREARGLTQEELARRLDIGTKSVWRWEKGTAEPRAGTLPALARELRVTLSWLLTGEDDEGERLERDDDPFIRRPNLAKFVERFAEKYSPATLKALEVLAFEGGHEPSLGDYLDAAEEYEQRVVVK